MLFFAVGYGPLLVGGGRWVASYGPVLFDGFGIPLCVPGVGMVIGS